MKRYGDPYIPDTSPLELNWEKSCVLRCTTNGDELHFCWSETEDKEMVGVSYISGYGKDDRYVFRCPQIALSNLEFRTMSRAVGRGMFSYLIKKGWVLQCPN